MALIEVKRAKWVALIGQCLYLRHGEGQSCRSWVSNVDIDVRTSESGKTRGAYTRTVSGLMRHQVPLDRTELRIFCTMTSVYQLSDSGSQVPFPNNVPALE